MSSVENFLVEKCARRNVCLTRSMLAVASRKDRWVPFDLLKDVLDLSTYRVNRAKTYRCCGEGGVLRDLAFDKFEPFATAYYGEVPIGTECVYIDKDVPVQWLRDLPTSVIGVVFGGPSASVIIGALLLLAKRLLLFRAMHYYSVPVTDFALEVLGATSLTLCDLTGCSAITDNGVRQLALCGTLSLVNLEDCMNVTDAAIEFLCVSCRGLRAVYIGQKDVTITSAAFSNKSLTSLLQCPSLERLAVRASSSITDAGVSAFAEQADLYYVDLSGCSNITDESLHALAASGTLTAIDVSHVSVTDFGVRALLEKCPLEYLNVSYCDNISEDLVLSVLRSALSGNKTLSFKCDGCSNVRSEIRNTMSHFFK